MNKLLIVLLFLTLGTVPALAGMHKGQVEISPVLGLSIPIGDFGNINDAGIAFGARGAYFISSNSSIGLSIVHSTMDFKSQFDVALGTVIPGAKSDFSVTEVSADFRYYFSTESSVSPYINGSVGIFMNRLSLTQPGSPDETDTQSEIVFGSSVGFLFRGQGSDAGFLEARIINNTYDFEGALPGSLKYLSVRGGITFFLGSDSGP